MDMPSCDLVITGGRVIDPLHDLDEVLQIGITQGRVSYVGSGVPAADRVIDATGHVVAPGFIDLHSHAQNLTGHRLQAFDGVTTSLELESGASPVLASTRWALDQGRPLHFGFSAGWLHSRIIIMESLSDSEVAALPPLPLQSWAELQDRTAWRQPATAEQRREIIHHLRRQLDAGALGIGMLLGYCPASTADELEAVAELAAARGVPLVIHARSGGPAGLTELLDLCRRTGARVHLCHFASTNSSTVAESSDLIRRAQEEGLPFTTESYAFGMASTVIGATFLDPDTMQARAAPTSRIVLVETGERVSSYERLAALRELDPGALVLLDTYDEQDPVQAGELRRALTLPGAAFASDAMPVQRTSTARSTYGRDVDVDEWPLPDEGLVVHPRSTSTFVRSIAWLARDAGDISLNDAVARCTTIPAQIMRHCSEAFDRKGHLGVGADADVTVFDLDGLRPNLDYSRITPNDGMAYVLVDGVEVVEDGELHPEALPGRALTSRDDPADARSSL